MLPGCLRFAERALGSRPVPPQLPCFSSEPFHLTLPVQCLPVGSAEGQPRLVLPPGHFV